MLLIKYIFKNILIIRGQPDHLNAWTDFAMRVLKILVI